VSVQGPPGGAQAMAKAAAAGTDAMGAAAAADADDDAAAAAGGDDDGAAAAAAGVAAADAAKVSNVYMANYGQFPGSVVVQVTFASNQAPARWVQMFLLQHC
jgi:hypothetical protein